MYNETYVMTLSKPKKPKRIDFSDDKRFYLEKQLYKAQKKAFKEERKDALILFRQELFYTLEKKDTEEHRELFKKAVGKGCALDFDEIASEFIYLLAEKESGAPNV